MNAVLCYAPNDYRLEEDVTIPKAGPLEVVVRVTACGVCAGDAKCFHGAPLFWKDPQWCQPPITPGHEFVGRVVELGEGAAAKYGLAIGDQAISEQIVPCWDCMYCQRGMYWLCKVHDVYGFRQRAPGGWAEYMVYPTGSIIHKVPNRIPSHEAAFTEPLSCAVHGVEKGMIQFGDTVVVSGCGAIGLGMVAAAKRKGPARIVALDCIDDRLALAKECGADVCFNPMKTNVMHEIKAMTGDYGCDVYLEASGNPASVVQGLKSLRRAGNFVEYSVFAKETSVDWTLISDPNELNIYGAHLSGNNGYQEAIRMLEQGVLPMDRIVTHQLPLADFRKAINLVDRGIDSVKTILVPDA